MRASVGTCPLCGRANDCGAEAGKATCWCFTATLAPDVLAHLPPEARGKACICAACARGEVPSPCTGVCQLDATGRACQGCGRTIQEIAAWPAMDMAGRLAVLRRCRPAATPS